MNAPLSVLVARLEHELETARLIVDASARTSGEAGGSLLAVIEKALGYAQQIREAL